MTRHPLVSAVILAVLSFVCGTGCGDVGVLPDPLHTDNPFPVIEEAGHGDRVQPQPCDSIVDPNCTRTNYATAPVPVSETEATPRPTLESDPSRTLESNPVAPGRPGLDETFVVQAKPKIDFVVAMDGSSSMPLEKAMEVLGGLATHLAQGSIDYRFILIAGKTSTNEQPGKLGGTLQEKKQYYVAHNTDCGHAGNHCLSDRDISQLDNGDFYLIDSFVHSFNAFDKIIERYNQQDAQGAAISKLHRPGAQLRVVIVSNDKACQMVPEMPELELGVTCVATDVWTYFSTSMAALGEKQLVLDAFVQSEVPAGNPGHVGEAYLLGAQQTQGMVGDLYGPTVKPAKLAQSYYERVSVTSRGTFKLKLTPYVPSITVFQGERASATQVAEGAAWTYHAPSNSIIFNFDHLPVGGSVVSVSYDY